MNRVSVEECQKVLVSDMGSYTGEVEMVEIDEQKVSLTYTECNYGGFRNWFVCPGCSGRVGVLYRKPLSELFLCRGCQNLTYDLRRFHRNKIELSIKNAKILQRL